MWHCGAEKIWRLQIFSPSGLPDVTLVRTVWEKTGAPSQRKTDISGNYIFVSRAINKHGIGTDGIHVTVKSSEHPSLSHYFKKLSQGFLLFYPHVLGPLYCPKLHIQAFCYCRIYDLMLKMYQECHRVHSSRSRCRVLWGGWRGRGVGPLCLPGWTAIGRSCSVCGLRGGWSPSHPVR